MKVRLETMSKLHCLIFLVVLAVAIVVIFGASFKAQYMLNFSTGDSYMCVTSQGNQANDGNGQTAIKCLDALHKDGYIWMGRLENLQLKNQILLVYGYVEQYPYDNSSLAHIPILEYTMYDVYIEILNKNQVGKNYLQNTHFKMAYINEGFTDLQIIVRVVFMILSLIVCIIYLCKICRIPRNVQQTYDQRQLVWISIACVFFNDPTYVANIFKPTFYTYIVSQLWLAIFFALLLQYWLRSVQRIKDEPTEQMLSQRSAQIQVSGVRRRSPMEIIKTIYFILFIIDILVLYVMYLYNVKENPGFSHFQKVPTVLLAFLGITAFFLLIYLLWFTITVIKTLVYFCQLTQRSRIMFIFSILMLLICLGTLAFGVYSPFYSNGQIFIFFIALFNIYVWCLVYLNWPTELSEMINLEEIEMEIRFSRDGDDKVNRQHQGYDMHRRNGLGSSDYMGSNGKYKVETEEEKQTDNSQVVATGSREIRIEF